MIKLTVNGDQDELVAKAADLFTRRWRERTCARLSMVCPKPAWDLVIETGMAGPPQSYAITTTGRTVTIRGTDGHGVLYGVGYLLRQLVFEPARVAMPVIRETRMPTVYNRGVYFATHFNNWYEAAPIGRVERYIEEMALWGCDLLTFWLDLNWYPYGFWKDPESRGSQMVQRLRRIGEVARACGMKVGSGGIANEGFSYQPPPELRADPSGRQGGFYQYSQICPSKPGGLEMILANRRKMIELVGPLDVYWHWPYDQGGCGCAECTHAPGRWGRKFLEIGPAIIDVVRESNPNVRTMVSTWLMDETERNMVYELCNRKADWFQGIITQTEHARERAIDPRYEWLVFPEISMFDCYFISYGSNGANPAPERMAREAGDVARKGCGTTLYSEGLYEDVNKALYLSTLWSADRAPAEILAEYSRYYFGARNVSAASKLISGLEKTWGAGKLVKAEAVEVNRLAAEADRLGKRVPRLRDARERWRVLRDRAEMDRLMKESGPPTTLAKESRDVFEGAHVFPIGELRERLKKFIAALRQRRKTTERLFDTHWKYMESFHLDKTVLLFLPDDVMGRQQWDTLIAPLEKVVRLRDEAALRKAVSRAFKRWFWFNGIDIKYLFQ